MKTSFTLFCLHHAGGTRHAYMPFAKQAPDFLNVKLLEYPGRGQRLNETGITDAIALSKWMLAEIKDQLHLPYALFGHSMGALVGFLMAREIRQAGYPQPKFLLVTGREGPAITEKQNRHLLPDDEFLQVVRKLGGISDEVLYEPEIMNFFLPMIRADFKLVESYEYIVAEPLQVPVCVVIGTQEDISIENAQSWQQETIHPIHLLRFEGDHFFIFNHTANLMKLIVQKVNE